VVGGAVVVVVGGGGGVVGGAVGGGLVGAGVLGAGLAGAAVGRVVVGADGLDPGWDVGGTVTIVPELAVRLSVPFDLTVNQLFKKACPTACDLE
jgi:hypothetical protein